MKTKVQQISNSISNGMCRLCLNISDDENSVEIFDPNETSLTVRIMACAGLEVIQQDTLPKRICVDCRLMLEKSFLFRNKCKNSDSKLRRHFRLINAGKVSRVFDDSEDEFEDDYTESIKVINELERRLEEKQKSEDVAQNANDAKVESDNDDTKPLPIENQNSSSDQLGTVMRPRTSNRLKNISENKMEQASTSYDGNRTIEVLMDELDDETDEIEYVLADSADAVSDDLLHSADSNDGLNPLFVEDDGFEAGPFVLQNIAKDNENDNDNDNDNELDIFDDSMDDQSMEGDDTEYSEENYDALILQSILPKIKQSFAAKDGTVLDDQTQYKIIRSNESDIKVQCTASDGRIFEIEMVEQSNLGIERDESGDLKIFACSKCPKTFSRRGKLINHERDHSAKSNGQECPYCQKWFPSNSTLTRHIRVHTGEKPFKCNVCNRSFIQKEILKRHLMTHSGERPFKCDHCPKSFILKEALRQHIHRNHTENPEPVMHNCQFCPKSFCHSSGLSRHLLIHAGRTFACEYCAKKFNDKSALKRHTASIHMSKSKK